MHRKPASVVAALVMLGIFPARPDSPTENKQPGDVGSTEWFKTMRTSDTNLAMLKALAGSNGQPVVPHDCIEISAVFTFGSGNPYRKGSLPHLRIVSTDDRIDNVPRSPYIYQTPGEAPNFYSVLKRDLTYEFYWLDGIKEEKFATWRVPPGAAKQLRLVFAIDGRGSGKIALAGADRRGPH
jgi:hypothetical protein